MEAHQLEFWAATAQISAVFALALVIELRSLVVLNTRTRMSLTGRIGATTLLVVNGVLISVAFFSSMDALYFGTAELWQYTMARVALMLAFALLVAYPLLALILVVWWKPWGQYPRRSDDAE